MQKQKRQVVGLHEEEESEEHKEADDQAGQDEDEMEEQPLTTWQSLVGDVTGQATQHGKEACWH